MARPVVDTPRRSHHRQPAAQPLRPDDTCIETDLGVYELFENGVLVRADEPEWVCRYWAPDEMHQLLEDSGFVRIHATKGFTSLPLDGDETIVSFFAVKPPPTNPA